MHIIDVIDIEKSEDTQIIIGHSSFIKTVEDIYEACVNSVPNIKFGIAFVEASGKRLLRSSGNDLELEKIAVKNMQKINAGHSFLVLFKNAFPINVLKHIKDVPEISNIYCATANPIKVVRINNEGMFGIIGIIDGYPSIGLETDLDKSERHDFLRKIGYKL